MKDHPEFLKALATIAGHESFKKGTLTAVHQKTGIPHVKLRRWVCYGIATDTAVQIWHLTGGKANLAHLTLEAGIIDKRKEKRAGVAV